MASSGITGVVPIQNAATTILSENVEVIEVKAEHTTITVEEYIKNYFSDIPVLVEVAKCESRFRQHDRNGKVLRGVQNNLDVGVMQINEYYHADNANKLGYDISTIEGNTAYARNLFERSGVAPWKSSQPCWGKSVAYGEYKNLSLNK